MPKTVRFVDDEAPLVRIGQQMLEMRGYEVVAGISPIEALEAFRADPERIDLVITDQTMPKMTGDVLTQELMRLKSRIPLIICSGFSDLVNREKARPREPECLS